MFQALADHWINNGHLAANKIVYLAGHVTGRPIRPIYKRNIQEQPNQWDQVDDDESLDIGTTIDHKPQPPPNRIQRNYREAFSLHYA